MALIGSVGYGLNGMLNNNLMPCPVLDSCIALHGLFPPHP